MRNKPELLASAGSLEQCKKWFEAGADAVEVGEDRFGVRLPGNMSLSAIEELMTVARTLDKKVYISVNNVFANDDMEELESYLKQLVALQVDGVIFGDPAVIMILEDLGASIPLHWNAEMTSTNYATAQYWGDRGATRFVAARELNMEEIHDIARRLKMELQVQVHGITNIYHSRRSLVESYMQHQDKRERLGATDKDGGLYLIEQERQDEHYPVYEDRNGTHIMSGEDISLLEVLDELLEVDLDSLKIETLLKTDEYNEAAIKSYRQALDAYYADPEGYAFDEAWIESIRKLQPPNRELGFGFMFKELVY